MLVVLFEVKPYSDKVEDYLATAAGLKAEMERVGGCLFIERFRSLDRAGTLLSFQCWRDEAAITAWRTNLAHHGAQMHGRTKVFEDYRLRVAEVVESREPNAAAWRPVHHGTYNDPAFRPPRPLMVVQSAAAALAVAPPAESEAFESLYRPGRFLHVIHIADSATGCQWAANDALADTTRQVCEVERDYGMMDRAEAPQYCPVIHRS